MKILKIFKEEGCSGQLLKGHLRWGWFKWSQ